MRYSVAAVSLLAVFVVTARLSPRSEPARPQSSLLLQETFDDTNLDSRGWYDGTTPVLTSLDGRSSIEYTFIAGHTKPTSGSPLRRKFWPVDSVYLSYYVKYSANWVGSRQSYHPHEFHFLTTEDGDWVGLSNTHLTAYIEQNAGTPLIAIQDGANIDQTRIGVDLTSLTEDRAAAGCNGSSDANPGHCYDTGSGYLNEKKWLAPSRYFLDTPGSRYKSDWHFVEAYVRLNAIAGGRSISDGVVRYWFDRQPVIDRENVLLRTAFRPTMRFNQLVIAPYIGDGSPVTQSMWIDDVTVAIRRP